MGLGGVSLFKLIIVLLILVLIFGTKRLKALAAGFGGAAKSFRESASDVPAPRQAKLDNAEPDAEFPERRRGGRA
jgi:sec-independent protein translocase protein TatA